MIWFYIITYNKNKIISKYALQRQGLSFAKKYFTRMDSKDNPENEFS